MTLIRTRLGGYNFWFKKGDKVIGERISLRKYERFETYLFKKLSTKSGIAVDVGANIGYYSLILSKIVKKVFAFEPEPLNLKLLRKNVNDNKISNIVVVPKAASDAKKKLSLGLSSDNFGDHQISVFDKKRKVVGVESISLDSFLPEKVSILKIDTQGWEPKVVSGAREVIKRDKPTIFMEFWPDGYKRSGLDYRKMIDFLEKVYGKIYLIDDQLSLVYPISKDSLVERCNNDKGYVDLLFRDKMSLSDVWICIKKFRLRRFLRQMLNSFKNQGNSRF